MARPSHPFIIAAAAACFSSAGIAEDAAKKDTPEAEPPSFRMSRLPPLPNLETFSSSGTSPAGLHTSYGFKWAFADTISEPAWLLTGTLGSGSSPTASEEGAGLAFDVTTKVMVGRQETFGRLYAAGFLGPEMRTKVDLFQDKPVKRLYGLRAETHLWYRPTDDTVYGWVLSAGTIELDLWSRGRAGLKVLDFAVIGPEITFAASAGRAEIRLGAFAAEIELLGRRLETGFGGMRDTQNRSGWYATLAHMTRF